MISGFLASVLIGISLGLIGGGGSILTVPVLVYLFGVDPVLATAYSLFIVGATSLAGVLPKYREGLVDIKTAVIFWYPVHRVSICYQGVDSTCHPGSCFVIRKFRSDQSSCPHGAVCHSDDLCILVNDQRQISCG